MCHIMVMPFDGKGKLYGLINLSAPVDYSVQTLYTGGASTEVSNMYGVWDGLYHHN